MLNSLLRGFRAHHFTRTWRESGEFTLRAAALQPAIRPVIETLERRVLMSSIQWANVGSNWNTGSNWVGGVVPGSGDTAVFPKATTIVNPNLTAAASVSGITIDNSAANYSITETGSQTLSIGSGGLGVSAPTGTSVDATTIGPNISLSASQTWSVANNNVSTTLTAAGVISGSGALTKVGGGTLTLSATETYTGDTTISLGTLKLGVANALPGSSSSGNLIDNATLDLGGYSAAIGGLSGSGTVTTSAGAPTLFIGANNASASFSGTLQNGSGTLAVAKIGTGTETLNGSSANSFTGLATVSGGTLVLGMSPGGAPNYGSAIQGNVLIDSGATLQETAGGQINNSSNMTIAGGTYNLNGQVEGINNLTMTGGAYTNTSPGYLVLGTGSSNLGVLTTNASSTVATLAGAISFRGNNTFNVASGTVPGGVDLLVNGSIFSDSGSGGLLLNGAGTVELNNSSDTYTGNTTLSSGSLILNNLATFTSPLVDNTAVTFNQTTSNLSYYHTISGSGAVIKTGSGTLSFVASSTSNTYSGLTTISGGTLSLGMTPGAAPIWGSAIQGNVLVDAGATLLETQPGQINDSSNMTLAGGTFNANGQIEGINSLTMTGGSYTNSSPGFLVLGTGSSNLGVLTTNPSSTVATLAGTISFRGNNTFNIAAGTVPGGVDALLSGDVFTDSGTGGLIKTGAGTLELTDTRNSYNGSTIVSAGTLRVDGSLPSTSAVTVDSAATLNGTGSIPATVSVASGGIFSPGDGIPGALSTGNLTLASGSNFNDTINGSSAGSFGEVNVTGAVSLASPSLNLTGTRTNHDGDVITLINNDGTDAVSGTFLNLPGRIPRHGQWRELCPELSRWNRERCHAHRFHAAACRQRQLQRLGKRHAHAKRRPWRARQ